MKNKFLVWTLTFVLLAAAWGVSKATLPDDAATTPFPAVAALDEPVVTRDLAVTVTDVHRARHVADADGWSADANWFVVDLEAASVIGQDAASLQLAQLVVGDRVFHATERGTTLYEQRLFTGVPRSGSLAFELPEDVVGGTATLRLSTADEPLLDGVVELPLQLDEIPVETEVELDESGWAR